MATPLKALIVEDSEDDARLLVRELTRGGYDMSFERVETRAAVAEALGRGGWDIVFSDYTMPHFRGTDALALLQEWAPGVPFIFVSGTMGEDVAVAAMHAGAQDYVVKGHLKRLVPAVDRELRQAKLRRERQRDEEALRLSDSILKQIGNLVLVADSSGLIRYASPSVRTILGYEPEEVLGDSWWRLTCATQEEADHEKTAAAQAASGEVPVPREPYERAVRARDGSVHWILWNDSKGPGDSLIGVGYDITERKSLELQLRQAQKMEAVGRLAGGIAHDFNNLLTVILGECDLALADAATQPAGLEAFQEIRRAGERAAMLTRQLLAFSRKQLLEPTVFDVNDLVRGAEKLLRRLIGEDIEVTTRLFPEALTVKADRGQMEQVLVNLVVNARDAMPQGGKLHLETAAVTLDDEYAHAHHGVLPGSHVCLAVTDDGSGMSDEVRTHLFEPFFTTKEPGKGTGLGLATTYGILKQFGGHVGVYSEPGIGTTMKVYLPRTAEGVTRDTAEPGPRPGGTETVLLVEDDNALRQVATRILSALGYRVVPAADGEEALAWLQGTTEPVHLLLTDVVLPKMGGRIVAERAQQLRPGLRVLFASGYTDDVILQQQLLERSAPLIQKPFMPDGLARKVRQVLDSPQSGGAR